MFLFSIAYRWTEDPNYLRVINHLIEGHNNEVPVHPNIHLQMNPTMGLPVALGVLKDVDSPIAPFPALRADGTSAIAFDKDAGVPVTLGVFLRMSDGVSEDTQPAAVVRPGGETGWARPVSRCANADLTRWALLLEPSKDVSSCVVVAEGRGLFARSR